MSVLIETTEGNIVIDLFVASSPDESLNFLKLCKLKYYHYSPFINIQKDFIVETGNPSYPANSRINNIIDIEEFKETTLKVSKSSPKHNDIGFVSFFKTNNDSFESRFVITTTNDPRSLKGLDGKTTVFGKVVEGFSTLNKINCAILDESQRPLKDIRILHTFILDDPFLTDNLTTPPNSPLPTRKQIESFRLLLDSDDYDDDKNKNNEIRSTSQALTLELLGDIPTSNIKPSEKVLFICKLNPVTKEQDLKIIFSRFGTVKSVDIIKEKETGDSLCYGFIEFEDKECVEASYLKMDNVLIDDRRIHVDFSQSIKHRNDQLPGDQRSYKDHYKRAENNDENDKYRPRHAGHRSKGNSYYRDQNGDRHRSRRDDHRSDHRSSRHISRAEERGRSSSHRKHNSSSSSRH